MVCVGVVRLYLDLGGEITLHLHSPLGPVLVVKHPVFHLLGHLLNLLQVGEAVCLELQQGLELVPSVVDLLQLLLQNSGLLLLRLEVVRVHSQVVHQADLQVVQLVGVVITAVVELLIAAHQTVKDDLVLADPVGWQAELVPAGEADGVDVGQELLTDGEYQYLVSGSEIEKMTNLSGKM